MYEMYPDAWMVTGDRQQRATGQQPRRRARKEHSVVPAVLPSPVNAQKDHPAH